MPKMQMAITPFLSMGDLTIESGATVAGVGAGGKFPAGRGAPFINAAVGFSSPCPPAGAAWAGVVRAAHAAGVVGDLLGQPGGYARHGLRIHRPRNPRETQRKARRRQGRGGSWCAGATTKKRVADCACCAGALQPWGRRGSSAAGFFKIHSCWCARLVCISPRNFRLVTCFALQLRR